MDFNNVLKEMKRLQQENIKAQNMRERYVVHAQKLKRIRDEIDELMKEIDPLLSVKTNNRSELDYKEIIEDFYTRMEKGLQISREDIEKAYPELDYSKSYYVIKTLKDMKNVLSRKDGRILYLYIQKETL